MRRTLHALLLLAALGGCSDAQTPNPRRDPGRDGAAVDDPADGGSPAGDCAGLVACGMQCVDLDTDPANCGACGRTCRIPNGEAGCADGDCTVASCDEGFVDADDDPTNGCESEDDCAPGTPCMTECGSEGTTECEAGQAHCVLPPESCNAVDDDCNGACDEGALAGCRAGVHRAYGNGHLYTTDAAAAGTAPFSVESENYFWIYAEDQAGLQPMFLCRKSDGKHLLTSSTNCEGLGGGARVAQLGFWAPEERCDAAPLHRLYNADQNNHFYTLSAAERDRAATELGYRSEGIAGWVWTDP